ncbi:MAG: PEP-CTERM sorting domain-containing protein [Planctomycetota bacterium]|nr:MAG: PEP-CTERM sorting domain-containing protein [Planctomycetota bacterium]
MTKRKFCILAFCSLVPALMMSSVASATLSMDVGGTSVDVGVAVVITISSDTAEAITWGVYLDPTSEYPSNAQMQNATILADAGVDGAVTSGGNPDSGHDYISGPTGGPPSQQVAVGNWSTVEFVGLTVGMYTIDLTTGGAGGTQLATADIQVVPEPSTVCLLGLGSLVLLRRRRH